jgi:hypothetical protein
MKKTIALLFIIVGLTVSMRHQKSYNRVFYEDITLETPDATLEIRDAVASAKETKFKIRIINKTDDYLAYKAEESKFVINNEAYTANERILFVQPKGTGSRVVNLKGPYNHVLNYVFELGGLYKASSKGDVVAFEDFNLSSNKTFLKSGPFLVDVPKVKQENAETKVKLKVFYNGKRVGIFNPQKVVGVLQGKEYAITNKKEKPSMLLNGMDDGLSLEWVKSEAGIPLNMQNEPMKISWKNAFFETTLVKLDSYKLNFKINDTLTTKNNK